MYFFPNRFFGALFIILPIFSSIILGANVESEKEYKPEILLRHAWDEKIFGIRREPLPPTGPTCIAVDRSGNIYVGDAVNHRVVKFDNEGNFMFSFGRSAGDSLPKGERIDFLQDMVVDIDGNIYICDWGRDPRIKKFDRRGLFLCEIRARGARLNQLNSIRVDSRGNIYVTDVSRNKVAIFDRNLQLIKRCKSEENGEELFISDSISYSIKQIDGKGSPRFQIEKSAIPFDSKGGQISERLAKYVFMAKESISVCGIIGEDMRGDLYIAYGVSPDLAGRVLKFDPVGNYLGKIVTLKSPLWHYMDDSGYIAPNGDIYFMRSNEREVWIERYPTELFKK